MGLGERISFRTLVLRDLCGSWVSQCGVILRGLTWIVHFRLVDKMLFKTMTLDDLTHFKK